MIFTSFDLPLLAALALIRRLYHTLNHALFKGLLFMGGRVLHATHDGTWRDGGASSLYALDRGVLPRRLHLDLCAPAFNGFVSEWLTYQRSLLSPGLPSPC